MDMKVVETLIGEQFKGKDKLIAPNIEALHLGFDYAKAHFDCPIGLRLRHSDKVGNRISIDGNAAAALGAVYGGATVCAWYPDHTLDLAGRSVPALLPALSAGAGNRRQSLCHHPGRGRAGLDRHGGGAAWNGARAFTATSGPGISLMTEFIGLAYFAEIPAVIFNVQRGGPSTGMPTRTQQADILACAYASHGDTKHVLLSPRIRRNASISGHCPSIWPTGCRRRSSSCSIWRSA
ncbi:MAG: hypothetical protein WDN69_02785 [Aliidongia sp.]